MSLNPQQFFHASKRNLSPGVDQIRPANEVGGSNYGYSKHDNWQASWYGEEDRGDYTFAADTEEEAEAWFPSSHGRPTTYVVDPGGDYEEEDQHIVTDSGMHIKKRGSMNITDRIDIPRPEQEGESVQGTLPPENWGRHAKTYDPNANFKRIHPPYERMQQENQENSVASIEKRDQILYQNTWKRAGQQELF